MEDGQIQGNTSAYTSLKGDIILLSLRDYQDEKGDVILKYSAESDKGSPFVPHC